MPRREPIALHSSPRSRNLGQEHYPFSYRLTGRFCSEVGTTRYSPIADVPCRSRRLNNRSFHYTSVLVSSTRFLNEACLAAPSRLALMVHCWRGSVGDYRFGAITSLILTGQRSRTTLKIEDFRLLVVEKTSRKTICNLKFAI